MLHLTPTNQPDRQLKFSHATDTGQPGMQNSDAYLIFPTEGATPWDEQPEATWFVLLANGAQNHTSSRVASQLAVESVYQQLVETGQVGHSIAKRLDTALLRAHTTILETSLGEPDLLGMQTSMLAAAVSEGNVHFARTGDYGAFLYREGTVQRILLEDGAATELQDASSPLFTVAETRALQTTNLNGSLGLGNADGVKIAKKIRLQELEQKVEPFAQAASTAAAGLHNSQTKELSLLPNDILILCSSSMTNALTPANIRTAIANYPLEDVADQLIRQVKENGVAEDATAVVVRWTGDTVLPQENVVNQSSLNWSVRKSALALMAALLATSIWFAAGTLFDGQPGIASQNQGLAEPVSITATETALDAPVSDANLDTNSAVAIADDSAHSIFIESTETEAVTAPVENLIESSEEPVVNAAVAPTVEAAVEVEQPAVVASLSTSRVDASTAEPKAGLPEQATGSTAAASSALGPLAPDSEQAEPSSDAVANASLPKDQLAIDRLLSLLYSLPVPSITAEPEQQMSEPSTEDAREETTSEIEAPTIDEPTADEPIVDEPTVEVIEPAVPVPSVETAIDAQVEPQEPLSDTVVPSETVLTETAPPETEPQPEADQNQPSIYLLKEGDNLWTIAWENDLTVEDLLAANPFITSKDQILSIGTELVIPNK